jgi:hypothetical protein
MTTTTQRVYTALDRALTGPATDPRRTGTVSDRLEYMTDAVVAALDIPPFEDIVVDGPEIPAVLQDAASALMAAIKAEFGSIARYMEARVDIIADMGVTPPKITGIIIRDIQHASIPPQRKK